MALGVLAERPLGLVGPRETRPLLAPSASEAPTGRNPRRATPRPTASRGTEASHFLGSGPRFAFPDVRRPLGLRIANPACRGCLNSPGPGPDPKESLARDVRSLGGALKRDGWKAGALGGGLGGILAGLNLEGSGSVIEAISVLALIVAAHECGHFLAARLQNIHVTKFAIGFGPTLLSFKRKNVEYSLRAFPLGGFVAFPDDDPNSPFLPDDPDLLKNRPIYQRALVISAGVIANLVLAFGILFTQVNTVGLLHQTYLPGVKVPEVVELSAAERAGLQPNDVIFAVDDEFLSGEEGSVEFLVNSIKSHVGQPLQLGVLRDSQTLTLSVVPDRAIDGSGRIGVQLSPNADVERLRSENLVDGLALASKEYARLTGTVLNGLSQILFNFSNTADRVSGPVAIVAVGAEVARADVSGLFQFAAIVNINLAVVNSLPLPALDGGYLVFLMLEAARGGRKLPNGVEQGIMSSGILLLLAMGMVLIVKDTLSLGFFARM